MEHRPAPAAIRRTRVSLFDPPRCCDGRPRLPKPRPLLHAPLPEVDLDDSGPLCVHEPAAPIVQNTNLPWSFKGAPLAPGAALAALALVKLQIPAALVSGLFFWLARH